MKTDEENKKSNKISWKSNENKVEVGILSARCRPLEESFPTIYTPPFSSVRSKDDRCLDGDENQVWLANNRTIRWVAVEYETRCVWVGSKIEMVVISDDSVFCAESGFSWVIVERSMESRSMAQADDDDE